MSERIIDAQGTPGGKASTEVEAAAVKGEMGVVDLERLWSNVPPNNIAWSAHTIAKALDRQIWEALASLEERIGALEVQLCQRVTELEAEMAELLEEKNEPPDPDWERERGSD